jgi:hypothetical protein
VWSFFFFQVVFAARGQTLSVAFYPKLGLVCYGSEAAATKAPLAVVPASPSDLAMAAALAQGADIEEVFFVRVSLRPASCRRCRKPKVWAHCRLLIRTRQQTFFHRSSCRFVCLLDPRRHHIRRST